MKEMSCALFSTNKCKYALVALLASALLGVLGSAFLYAIDIFSMLRFMYVLLFWVWTPGALLVYLGSKKKLPYGFWTLSFATGIIFVSIAFAMSMYLSFPLSKTFLGPLGTLLFVYLYFFKEKNPHTALRSVSNHVRSTLPFWILGILLAGVVVLVFSLRHPSPALVNGPVLYNSDFLWSISNIEAFLRSFPPVDSRISGVTFYYHYFSMLYRAALCNLSSVGSFDVATFFYPIANMFFLVFSLRFFALSFVKKKPFVSSLLFAIITLMTTCASSILNLKMSYGFFFNVFPLHTYTPTHGFELSLPLFLIALGIIAKLSVWANSLGYFLHVFLFFLSFAATAAKGPAGALLSLSALAVLVIFIIKNLRHPSLSDPKIHLGTVFSASFACAAGFAAAYFFLLPTEGVNTLFFAPGWLAWKTFGFGKPYTTSYALLIPLHVAGFLPFGFLGGLAWLYSKRYALFSTPSFAAVFMAALAGTGGAYLLRHAGSSNLYFMMFAVPCYNLLATAWLVENFGALRRVVRIFWCTLLALALSSFLCTVTSYGVRGLVSGVHVLLGSPVQTVAQYGLARDEFFALQWISENTPSDALIAGEKFWTSDNRSNAVSGARYFYYSVFSKRQVYLEGWAYSRFAWFQADENHPEIQRKLDVLGILFGDGAETRELMLQEGIQYLVVDKILRPNFSPLNLVRVFENESVAVFGF